MRITSIDHVQLAMPPGQEQQATDFYSGLLGLRRVAKPPNLEKRGGCWFEGGAVRLHLGVETDFRPARKAHVALLIEGLAELVQRLDALRFYQRRGLRIAAVHRDSVDLARQIKPQIPAVGSSGIGIHDDLELEFALS